MKTCLRLTLFLCLLLSLSAAAQPEQVPNSCGAGSAFTIKVPVKFSAGTSVEYEWYRNDMVIAGTLDTLAADESVIAYTVPDTLAYGDNVAFYFKYRLDDSCDEWTSSPKYVITFLTSCPPPPGVISVAVCSDVSIAGTISITACSDVSVVGTISVAVSVCNDVSDMGTVSVAACNDVSIAGIVSVAACNDVSVAGTVSVAACNDLSVVGTISVAAALLQISPIAGDKAVCSGSTGLTYWVDNESDLTYSWTVPAGWTITAGQNTNSITVTAGMAGGTISVVSSSLAGADKIHTLEVTANVDSYQPSAITGSTIVCAGTTELTYSVENVAGITYTWAVPSDWTITAGQNTDSITVVVDTFGGTVSVTPIMSNGCVGTARTLEIAMTTTAPVQPTAITGSGTIVCAETAATYSVANVAGVTYTWTVPTGWTITAGQGTNSITVVVGVNGGAVSVTPSNCRGSGTAHTLAVATVVCGNTDDCWWVTGTGIVQDGCTGLVTVGSITDACIGVISVGSIPDTCIGVTSVGSIPDVCTGITSVGSIPDTCTGITSVGSIPDTCTGIISVGSIE